MQKNITGKGELNDFLRFLLGLNVEEEQAY
jgi:hypothetical protein